MNFEITFMGLAIYLLVWEKLPEWGNWFDRMIQWLPSILKSLYEGWRCPYCSGFWISLLLQQLTGLQTLSSLQFGNELVLDMNYFVHRFLDALASATCILFLKLLLDAVSGYALKGYLAKKEFKEAMKKS